MMAQYAPFPEALDHIAHTYHYKPGWTFDLRDKERDPADTHGASAGGLTFTIFASVNDSYHPGKWRPVHHIFSVPAATFNAQAWRRWVFDRCCEVEIHEASEWFRDCKEVKYGAEC